MIFAWNTVESAENHNVRHRKGFTMRGATLQVMTDHAREELDELDKAHNSNDPDSELDELADVFGCLIHYAVRKGWSMKEVEDALLRKLFLRLNFAEAGVNVEVLKAMANHDS